MEKILKWSWIYLKLCSMIIIIVHCKCDWNLFCFCDFGTARWLERQTLHSKVLGSSPCRISWISFFSRVNFLCWLLLRYLFRPRVTAVAHKRPRSFRQKCRWQVTAKHACTWRMWLCMKWHGAWLYGVHKTHWDGSSFMWHQSCQCRKYPTLADIQKYAIKS